MMEYKGYIGGVEFDDEANLLHGEVVNTRDAITFQAQSVDELRKSFEASVDDYLSFCSARNENPDKPFSGKFSLRIAPTLHRKVFIQAKHEKKSLNAWVSEKLETAVSD